MYKPSIILLTISCLLLYLVQPVQAEDVNCSHNNKSLIRRLEINETNPLIEDVMEWYPVAEPEEYDMYKYNYGCFAIYNKSTDTYRYLYFHGYLWYCLDCKSQVQTYELCIPSHWRYGTVNDFSYVLNDSISGYASSSIVYACDCGRYTKSYPYTTIGSLLFTTMPKSVCNMGQSKLNTWYTTKHNGATWRSKAYIDPNNDDVISKVEEQTDDTVKVKIKSKKTSSIFTISKSNIYTKIKTIKIKKGKKLAKVKKKKSYMLVTPKKKGTIVIDVTMQSKAKHTVKVMIK